MNNTHTQKTQKTAFSRDADLCQPTGPESEIWLQNPDSFFEKFSRLIATLLLHICNLEYSHLKILHSSMQKRNLAAESGLGSGSPPNLNHFFLTAYRSHTPNFMQIYSVVFFSKAVHRQTEKNLHG